MSDRSGTESRRQNERSDPRGNGRRPSETAQDGAQGARDRATAALDNATDLAIAYKWPLLIGVVALGLLEATGRTAFWDGMMRVWHSIPPWVWSSTRYAVIGAIPATLGAYIILKEFDEPRGVEILDIHPIHSDHGHLRLGYKTFDEMRVVSPLGKEVGVDDLKECRINGRHGYEVIHYDREKNEATATWLGSASSVEMRTYKRMVSYIHQRLSNRADQYDVLRSNLQPIVREAASAWMNRQIAVSEGADLPEGQVIDQVLRETMQDYGVDWDPMTNAGEEIEPSMRDPREQHRDGGPDRGGGEVEPTMNGGGPS